MKCFAYCEHCARIMEGPRDNSNSDRARKDITLDTHCEDLTMPKLIIALLLSCHFPSKKICSLSYIPHLETQSGSNHSVT